MKGKTLLESLSKSPKLQKVASDEEFSNLAHSANDDLLNYLFGEEEDEFGKLDEILDIILTNKDKKPKDDDDDDDKTKDDLGTYFSQERKIAHNLCTLFTNKDIKTKKLNKIFNPESKLISRLKRFLNENSKDQVVTSRFSQLVRNLISIKNELVTENPWLLSPLLAFPDNVGYSTLLFTILRINPQYYKITAMRCSDFMRKTDKDHMEYGKCSFILLNIFSLLIKSEEFKIDSFNVEMMKDILDATLLGRKNYKLAFHEGIFVTSSILKKVEPKSPISRYVKARSKAFYKSLGLDDMDIKPDMDVGKKRKNENFSDIIASFPAFYKGGFNKLFPLMFCPHTVVSSDFGRTCLDYIVSMPEEKFNHFIDDNDIKHLIMTYVPKLPNDEEVMESEENIQFLNPHVIFLAFYLVDGLPKQRGTTDNTIVKNPYCPDSLRDDPEFIDFIVKNVLPFRQLVLPNLKDFQLKDHKKINGD